MLVEVSEAICNSWQIFVDRCLRLIHWIFGPRAEGLWWGFTPKDNKSCLFCANALEKQYNFSENPVTDVIFYILVKIED